MRNPFFLLMVFTLSALAAGWLYPGDRTPDLVSTAAAGGESRVLEESLKTVAATVARVDPASGIITLTGPDPKLGAFTTGEGVKNLPEVKAGDQVVLTYHESITAQILDPGNDPGADAQEALTHFEPNETPAGGLVQLVKMIETPERTDESQAFVSPKGPAEESAAIRVRDLTDL